jgi:beta-lactamase regulating signal transducer with metallopeptidase domain
VTSIRATILLMLGAGSGCFLLSSASQADPLFAVEAAGALVLCVWGATAVALALGSTALARASSARSRADDIAGVPCQVIQDRSRQAFAAGSLRPTVYVTTGAIDVLTDDELRAVLLHESHHARTRAPLRAAFVDAWLRIVRLAPPIRRRLVSRLATLETTADRFALEAGATRRQLASALVKLDSSPGVSFAGHADARVAALVGGSIPESAGAPLEWVPLLLILALAAGCRLAGTAMPV